MTKTSNSFHAGSKIMYGKKILSVLLTVFMLIGCFGAGFTVFADDVIVAQGQCGNTAYWKITDDGTDKTFIIYGTGIVQDRLSWTGDVFDAYDITKIKIEEGITCIGNGSFGGGSGTTDTNLGQEQSQIGGCYQSGSYYYPKSFYYATGTLVLPETLTTIGTSAFSRCANLTGSIEIPDSVTMLGANAFSGCVGFNGSLKLSNGLTGISLNAFSLCTGLTGVLNIPNNVTHIDQDAFASCRSFTGLEIPDSVTTIGANAFASCTGLTGTLTIPTSVTTINDSAFSYCSGLTGVEIPNTVTTLGSAVFSHCSGLTGTIEIPNSLTEIKASTFEYCSNITGITIPDSVLTIENRAFQECSSISQLSLPQFLTTIGEYAFSHCYSITGELEIPASVTTIGSSAFSYCYGFTGTLNIPNSLTQIEDHTFEYCSGFTGLIIPSSISSIGARAFYYCTGLTGILELPNRDDLTVGEDAFHCAARGNTLTYSGNLETDNLYNFFEHYRGDSPDDKFQFIDVIETERIDATETTNGRVVYKIYCADACHNGQHIESGNNVDYLKTVTETIRVPVQISMGNEYIMLQTNSSTNINYTVVPSGYVVGSVTYESSDPDLVTVSNGYVSSYGNTGSAIITVTFNNENIVKEIPVFVYTANLCYNNTMLDVGSTESLYFDCSDDQAFIKNIVASGYDNSIISVDANGNVTGLSSGYTNLFLDVTCEINGHDTVLCLNVNFEVASKVTNILLTDNEGHNLIGQTITLKKNDDKYYFNVSIEPSGASNLDLDWSYDDNLIYIGNCGSGSSSFSPYIEAYRTGTTTVTVSTTDGSNISKTFTVRVIAPVQDVSVSSSLNDIEMLAFDPAVYPNAYYLADTNGDPLQFDSNPLDSSKIYVFDIGGDAIKFEPYAGMLDHSLTGGYTFDPLFVYYMEGALCAFGYNNGNVIAYMPFEFPDERMAFSVDASVEFAGEQTGIVDLAPVTVFDAANEFGLVLAGTYDSNPIVDGQRYDLVYSMEEKDVRERKIVYDPDVLPNAYYFTYTDGSAWDYDKLDDDKIYIVKTESGKTYKFYPCETPDPSFTGGYSLQYDVAVCNTDDGPLYMGYCNGKLIIPITAGEVPSERTEEYVDFVEMDLYRPVVYEKLVGIGTSEPLDYEDDLAALGINMEYPYMLVYYNDDGNLEQIGGIVYADGKLIFPMEDGGMTDSNFSLSVVSVEPAVITLEVDETLDIRAAVQPGDASYSNLSVTIADPTVASYENNTLTGLAAGTTKMIVTLTNADDTEFRKEFDVNIKLAYEKHDRVEPTDGQDGNVEYYTDGENNIFVKDENDNYVPSDADSVILHFADDPAIENPVHTDDPAEYAFDFVTRCKNDNDVIDSDHVTLTKHDAVEPQVNQPGTIEYYTDENDNIYLWNNANNTYVTATIDDLDDEVEMTKHDAVPASDGHDATIEYYTDPDNNCYTKDDEDVYTQIDPSDIYVHVYGEPHIANSIHDETLDTPYQFDVVKDCTNGDDTIVLGTVALTKYDELPATANTTGNIEYYEDGDGNRFVYENNQYVPVENDDILTSITMTPVAAIEPSDNNDGHDAYYQGSDGKIYVKDDEGLYVETTADDIARHTPGTPVKENITHEDGNYSFDLVTYCNNDHDPAVELDRETVTLTKHDEIPATANTNGNVEYFADGNGNKYVWDEAAGDGDAYVQKTDAEITTSITMTPVAAVEPTDGQDGIDSHYEGSDNKLYVKNDDGQYVEVSANDLVIHKNSDPVKENQVNDEAGNEYSFELVVYCENDGDEISRDTIVLTKQDAVEADPNHAGNIEYFTDNNGNKYIWSEDDGGNFVNATDVDVSVPAVTVEYNSGSPASADEDGVLPHYVGNDGNLYVLENGRYVPRTASELVSHMTAVRRDNVIAPTCTSNGSYDEVTYCVNCGTTISSHHVVVKGGHSDEDEDGYCDVCNEEISWHCSKCDWFNENKDKGGVFGIVVRIVHMLVHMIESIHKLT